MTVLEHLSELWQRLIISTLGIIAGLAISAVFLTWPVIKLLSEPAGIKLVAISPGETFGVYMKVALTLGVALAMPVIVWQALLFTLPALHRHERKYIWIAVPSITLAFAAGLVFGYLVVVPAGVSFLIGFGGDTIQAFWSVDRYISFISSFLFWIGLSFETPLLMFFVGKLGVVKRSQMVAFRRYALIGAFIVAAFITPTPDPLNQTMVAVPLYVLFELGLLLMRFA